jgi:hypothetical protein
MPSWHEQGQLYLLPFTSREEGDLGLDGTIKITCEMNSSATGQGLVMGYCKQQ